MIKYVLKRILISIPLLLAMTFITFMFIQMAPGDFVDNLKLNPQISPETLESYKTQFHLDKPALVQYFYWLKNICKLELGDSFAYHTKVLTVIRSRAFNTIILSLAGILVSWLFAIPLGVFCALRKNRFSDRLLSLMSYVGISTPGFFLALLVLYVAAQIGGIPLGGMRSVDYEELSYWGKFVDVIEHMIVPVFVLALGTVSVLTRIMRSHMLEILNKQYIIAAKAKGLSTNRILFIHALRNALNPMITIFGYQFSSILSGAALVEIVCAWPGLGTVMLQAVRAQDIYLVMGSMLIGGFLLIAGNLLADILLAVCDPRIRYD